MKTISLLARNQEQYESFYYGSTRFIQYDYRCFNGELFSCVGKSLEHCRVQRDKWLDKKAKEYGWE